MQSQKIHLFGDFCSLHFIPFIDLLSNSQHLHILVYLFFCHFIAFYWDFIELFYEYCFTIFKPPYFFLRAKTSGLECNTIRTGYKVCCCNKEEHKAVRFAIFYRCSALSRYLINLVTLAAYVQTIYNALLQVIHLAAVECYWQISLHH